MWMPSERYAELPAVRKKIRKIIQAQMDRARQIAAEEQHKIQAGGKCASGQKQPERGTAAKNLIGM